MSLVVGYMYNEDVYCKNCIGSDTNADDVGAMFEWDEVDAPLHCSMCSEVIGGRLTKDGVKYMKDLWFSGYRNQGTWYEYMKYYSELDWFFIPTFYGLMDPLGECLISD